MHQLGVVEYIQPNYDALIQSQDVYSQNVPNAW